MEAEMRFACDAMLGSLARWLRFAGFDTLFQPALEDRQLAALARAEGRWLLTRDRRLAARAGPRVLLLAAHTLPDQVAELRRRLPLGVEEGRFFTRCAACNGQLLPLVRKEAAQLVPPYVATHAPSFRRCSACGRVYWPGSHYPRILRTLRELFGGA
jgi:uncharacterized protein with PIN domain